MSSQAKSPGVSLSFFGMVGAVMAALKFKQHFDGYTQVPRGEGTVALASPEDDDEAVSLLDTGLPNYRAAKKRSQTCCVCCGLNCGLFCKALGIVTTIFVGYYLLKLIVWAVTSSPTGLEGMPVYSTSLGCDNAEYGGKEDIIKVAMGAEHDHSFDIFGGAVATIVVAEGPESNDIEYKVSVRSDDQSLVDQAVFTYPSEDSVSYSHLRIDTPRISKSSCMRVDVTVYIPPSIRKLHIQSHIPAQVKFDENNAVSDLDRFHVTLYNNNDKNMILPHHKLMSAVMGLQAYRGWIVGDIAIVDRTSIVTQQGNATTNLRVHPALPKALDSPETAHLETTTGAGRTDIYYINQKSSPHRPIWSNHLSSSRNGDVYLTYKEAEFSGLLSLKSKSYSATGLQSMPSELDTWTHWVGDKEGRDRISVNSQGWTGIYL